jgi:hypothetical protein
MDLPENERFLEAIVAALLRRTGRTLSLPAREIAEASRCRLSLRADWTTEAVILTLHDPPRRPRRRRP